MPYYGLAPTPPRTRGFFEAVKARLDSPGMQAIVGGAGRIRMGDEGMDPLDEQDQPWGRVVVLDAMGPSLVVPSDAGRRRDVPFSVRVDIHSPGAGYDYRIPIEAAQQEVFKLLHGWAPGAIAHARVVGVTEQTDMLIGKGFDSGLDVWFETSGYRATLAPLQEG